MIIQSPYDDVELAPVPLHEYVLAGAAGRADRRALIDGPTGRVLTYAELAGSVRRAAAGLVAHGVAKGDTLALCSPNGPEFAVAYFAALAAGALVTTVNPLAPADDMARQLTHSGARWLITTAARRDRREPGHPVRLADRHRPRRSPPGGRPRRRRRAVLLEWDDRAAEGRAALAPQPGGQPGPDAGRPPGRLGRRGAGGAPAVPHLRPAGHAQPWLGGGGHGGHRAQVRPGRLLRRWSRPSCWPWPGTLP
jgi:hypothetical protein